MSTFSRQSIIGDTPSFDLSKRVQYNLGMVLGVDDFQQEQAYLAHRSRWLARDALGYGTLCGLKVTTEVDGVKGPKILVSPGVALSPLGQLICVTPAQCAFVNDWIAANRAKLTLPSAKTTVWVTLCYRECPMDPVPIPGEPCRTEEQLTADSRIADGFHLELRLEAPDQSEENLTGEFVAFVRRVLQAGAGAASHTQEQFKTLLFQALKIEDGKPPTMPPPAAGVTVTVPEADLPQYLRAALAVWIGDIRPRVHASGVGQTGCCGGIATPGVDGCLALAQVDLAIAGDGKASGAAVAGSPRPLLPSLRLLEELLLSSWGRAGSGPAAGPAPGATVRPESAFNQLANAGVSLDYARADHTHGTVPDRLLGDATGTFAASVVERLRGVPLPVPAPANDGQALVFRSLPPRFELTTLVGGGPVGNLAGDATGPLAAAVVERLRGVPLPVPTAVNDGQALVFRTAPQPRFELASFPVVANLAGDATGGLGAAVVTGLHKFPIVAPTPADDGEVLTFRANPARWELAPAAAGQFVRVNNLPAGSLGYFIAAAGRLRATGAAEGLTYNGLRNTGAGTDGVLRFTFLGYARANRYVVKVTPEFAGVGAAPPRSLQAFVTDLADLDIGLFISLENAPVNANNRQSVILHIEISQY